MRSNCATEKDESGSGQASGFIGAYRVMGGWHECLLFGGVGQAGRSQGTPTVSPQYKGCDVRTRYARHGEAFDSHDGEDAIYSSPGATLSELLPKMTLRLWKVSSRAKVRCFWVSL